MRTFAAIILIWCSLQGAAQSTFDNYFIDKVLRFDLMFAGNSQKTLVYPAGMKEEAIQQKEFTGLKWIAG
ncbi:MAG: hypothetical protein MUP53_03100 [Bacteroidales bacterium]|nr:hypothetical protein [Bacteroidales bacterium]